MKIMQTIRALKSDEEGATLVEYGIAITLAVVVGLGALNALGVAVDAEMTQAEGVLTSNDGGG